MAVFISTKNHKWIPVGCGLQSRLVIVRLIRKTIKMVSGKQDILNFLGEVVILPIMRSYEAKAIVLSRSSTLTG